MFVRRKRSGSNTYLQIVENQREGGKVRQRVIGTLGREDELRDTGQLEGLLASGAKFTENAMVLLAHEEGRLEEKSNSGRGCGRRRRSGRRSSPVRGGTASSTELAGPPRTPPP